MVRRSQMYRRRSCFVGDFSIPARFSHRERRRSFDQCESLIPEFDEDDELEEKLNDFDESWSAAGSIFLRQSSSLKRADVIEIQWVVAQLRKASTPNFGGVFLGRVSGGRRSVACWLRPEEMGFAVQIVVQMGDRRSQIFLPQSLFGDGWEGVALVLDGFSMGNGWVTKGQQRRLESGPRWPNGNAVVVPGVGEEDVVVRQGSGADWVSFLDSCLVGRVGELGEPGMELSRLSAWVLWMWPVTGGVQVKAIGGQYVLFIFSSQVDATKILAGDRRLKALLSLDWWSPDRSALRN
ncbi:hypothetical protein LOK49_LG15G02448 [Camellia lanceoleosa]|uniref:Uncharacterized protein n=1 Tax=Camellia lanceoleosa TaxID=1840588 RepID=A0ACC0F5Y2_9ERIC|nr:hypothetical protein LOK49_LG15G02448 [Camellia lanceoleosa]